MTLIKALLQDQVLTLVETPVIASGGVEEDVVSFDFGIDTAWEGYTKKAVFYRDESDVYHVDIGSDNTAVIPWEVLRQEGFMFLGVFGTKGSEIKTSTVIRYRVELGAITSATQLDPTPDIFAEIILNTAARHSHDNKTVLDGITAEKIAALDNIEGMLSENVEYIDGVVSDNKFDNNFDATGKIDLTTGADTSASTLHRTSEYHELWGDFDGTVYVGFPAKTSASEQKVQFFFYDGNKSFIGYSYFLAKDTATLTTVDGNLANAFSGLENLSQAKYYRVCKTISWDVQIYISPINPPSAGEIDYTYEIGKIPVTTGLAVNAPKKLQGKVIVNFGDSIFGKRRPPDDISTKLADLTGATVHNCGFGGCHMSNHWASTYNAFSMCNLADAIVSGTWTAQDNALLETGSNAVPSYFSEGLNILKTLDFSKVDIITIAYGTNDWNSGDEIDNEANQKSKDTYAGALRYSIETLLGTYPNLKIFICSQTYRFFLDDAGNYIDDSDTKTNTNNVKLTDFVAKTKEIARAYHLPFIDNYYSLGLNKFNRTVYFSNSQGAVTDGTHPNTVGCHLIAENMANELF